MDGKTDRGKTVYPLRWRGGIIRLISYAVCQKDICSLKTNQNTKGHKLHIGMPYCGKRFWTRQIPTSCLETWLFFMHIEHICGGIISEH
jgi:hypothetical protein